jgi:NADPH:quinone reductase-like Zn-dependent oxidoreductase
MNAVRLLAPGAELLTYERIPTPEPGPGEALVRVHAAAITRDELEWPVDRLPAVPSYEVSGVVAETGPGVEDVRPGDEVFALLSFDRDGAAADYVTASADLLAPKPRALDHVSSAALPLAGLSAWQGLFDHGQLARGERVLIHGGGGSVGALAVQLARQRGAHVTATASPASLDHIRRLGAHEVIDHTRTAFEEATGPVDLVFDTAGGQRLERSPAVLRDGGRLVSIATEPPDSCTDRHITALYFVVAPNRHQLAELARLADAGALHVAIDRTYPLKQAPAAFERTLDAARRGKVVLLLNADRSRSVTSPPNS